MEVPTRIIENDEYARLRALELEQHGFFHMLTLDAVTFNPPTEDNKNPKTVYTEHVHVQVLNVSEPCLHIRHDGVSRTPVVLLPKYDEFTHEDLAKIHPTKNAWGYVVAPHGWDIAHDDLDDVVWFFQGDKPKQIWI